MPEPVASPSIAVLGLGRMGAAMAARLASLGWEVTGWTRSGRIADSIPTVRDPAEATVKADVVILALFDGPACTQVLDRARPALRPGSIVVNTSTIAPAEAAVLAGELGGAYVHAPVVGSVRAVAAGTLEILAGADMAVLERVRPVLERLGQVRPVGGASTAAALKLVANYSLAGAVLALRDSLRQGYALGLPLARVLDVLELGALGGLVTAKRSFLAGEPAAAQFTIGALGKDMALLAGSSICPLRGVAELAEMADGPVDPGADFAVAATVPSFSAGVLDPLFAYIRGHATGDPGHFRKAFLPTAHIEGIRNGTFVSWRLDDYCALFDGHPAPDEPTRCRRIDAVDVHGMVATASMTLRHGASTFIDVFLLACVDGQWRIASKAYHRRAAQA
jgi:3-hydroxyisobutyrate dehydrogenase-like beta-hydroxyacid dehydrogenase